LLATNTGVSIQLPQFEGPLALLLYLIRKEEMDIFDISIHKITAQYLDYIKLMKELDLEVAGEFIAMAASLIQLKSRMLLPRYNDAGEIIEEEDPRKELVQKLLEYQKYQEVAKTLNERSLLGRDVWARGLREKFETPEEEIVVEDNGLFSLISAYRKAMALFKRKIHKVTTKTQSIASRILEIKDRLMVGRQVSLSGLITSIDAKRTQVLITFLSTLELAKMGFVRLFQSDAYQEIYIEAVKPIAGDEISKVEEYENKTSTGNSALGAAAAAVLAEENKKETGKQISFQLDDLDFVESETELEQAQAPDQSSQFELRDSNDENDLSLAELTDIATDDEILAAENELGLDLTAADDPALIASILPEDHSEPESV